MKRVMKIRLAMDEEISVNTDGWLSKKISLFQWQSLFSDGIFIIN